MTVWSPACGLMSFGWLVRPRFARGPCEVKGVDHNCTAALYADRGAGPQHRQPHPAPEPAVVDTLVWWSTNSPPALQYGRGRSTLELSESPDVVTAAVSDPSPAPRANGPRTSAVAAAASAGIWSAASPPA